MADLTLPPEDLEEISFYKKKHVIDGYFSAETDAIKRKCLYQQLLMAVHPDKKTSTDYRAS
jgi:hypothetical protein